jgi:hypothetical protein
VPDCYEDGMARCGYLRQGRSFGRLQWYAACVLCAWIISFPSSLPAHKEHWSVETGATMRWEPQVNDEANKGLHILKDLMLPVAKVSVAPCTCVCGDLS